jgi:hypothetical protein
MTKRKSKSAKTTVKAAAAKQSVTKSSAAPATATPPLIVLGFDDQQKPRGARFIDAKPNLVIKAAGLMGFKVYQASVPGVAEVTKKLPLGRLYANGRGFVPNIRQSLYTDVVAELVWTPQSLLSRNGDDDSLPAARGLPRSWDEIAAGHLVIAQESLEYGWWEAIVLDRSEETFTLQYRDYPHLPRFVRRRSGIALMCPADNGQSWNEITAGHLVIAQESAKEGWWEAIVIDRKADSLTLQFRDYPNLPKIVRHRSAIALMYRANEAHESEAGAQQA